MKYKGYDSNQFAQVISNIVEAQTSGGGYRITQSSMDTAISFFNQQKMPEFGTLLRCAFDIYFSENYSTEMLTISGDKIQMKPMSNVPALKNLEAFSNEANKLGNISLPIPFFSEIVSGLGVVFSVLSIFSNEPRTKSFNIKDALIKAYEANNIYKNKPAGSLERNILRTTGISMRVLADLRPKCVSPSQACALEHLRFVLRAEILKSACKSVSDISIQYFNDNNFKKFVDEYQLIVGVALPVNIKQPIQQQQQQQTEKKSSIVPVIAGVAGLYLLNKFSGS
ncbi:MAG: hypothetical protein IT232_08555 [Flavobacteriales bacterium]|nr:hypothetical protein [Flavobacteriales bacterium]